MEDVKQILAKDWYGVTTVNSVGLAVVLTLGVLMLLAPRRLAVVPIVILVCFITPAQRIVVAGFDFDYLRIMVLFGWTRLALHGEMKKFQWRLIDTLLLAQVLVGSTAYVILHREPGALSNRLGYLFTSMGLYFLFRFLIRDRRDLNAIVASFLILSIPVAVFFAIEYATGRNIFSVFGGVPQITQIRGGRLRVQGAFAHPIIAGVFWASVLPLIFAKWWDRQAFWRIAAPVGVVTLFFIIFATSSSTSVMSVVFCAVGGAVYFIRDWTRMLRWGIVLLLITLQMFMNNPIWHLLARATVFDSSTGWYRYNLIQQAVDHFGEWWLIGTLSTESWGLTDITNEFVLVGIRGGVLPVAFLVLVIASAFSLVGRSRRKLTVMNDRPGEILAWALGVSLFVHLMSFIALSYFGQLRLVWYLLLAMIASCAVVNGGRTTAPELAHEPQTHAQDSPSRRSNFGRTAQVQRGVSSSLSPRWRTSRSSLRR